MAVQEINSADRLLNIFRREIWRKKNTIFVPFIISNVLINKVDILKGLSVLQELGPNGLAVILEGEKYCFGYFLWWYLLLPLLSAFFVQFLFVLFKSLLSIVDFQLDKRVVFKFGVDNVLNLKLKGEAQKLASSLFRAEEEVERLRNREEAFDGFTFSDLKKWNGKQRKQITYKYSKIVENGSMDSGNVRWNFGKEIGIIEYPHDPDKPNEEQREVGYDLIGFFENQVSIENKPKVSYLTVLRHKRENGGIFLMLLRNQDGDNIYHGLEYEFEKLEESDKVYLFSEMPRVLLKDENFDAKHQRLKPAIIRDFKIE